MNELLSKMGWFYQSEHVENDKKNFCMQYCYYWVNLIYLSQENDWKKSMKGFCSGTDSLRICWKRRQHCERKDFDMHFFRWSVLIPSTFWAKISRIRWEVFQFGRKNLIKIAYKKIWSFPGKITLDDLDAVIMRNNEDLMFKAEICY